MVMVVEIVREVGFGTRARQGSVIRASVTTFAICPAFLAPFLFLLLHEIQVFFIHLLRKAYFWPLALFRPLSQ